MIVARLSISYNRGSKRNKPEDLGVDAETAPVAQGGGEVRGLGSHWVSAQAKETAKACEQEERRLRLAFDRRFPRAPIPGIYVLSARSEARDFLRGLEPDPRVDASVSVYDLAPSEEGLQAAEVAEWAARLRKQFASIPLGRGSVADAEGLAALERMAECPIVGEETRDLILETISKARLEQVDRVGVKRVLADMEISVDPSARPKPKRVLALPEEPEDEGGADPGAPVLVRRPQVAL